MPIKNAVEGGRIAREIWAKRLGRKPAALALNPDGTRPAAQVAATKPAASAEAAKPSTKPAAAKPTA